MRAVVAKLRKQGIRLVIYLDDILIIAASREECVRHLDVAIHLLISLGFIINEGKSCLTPSQQIRFLGYVLNSQTMMVSIPVDKCDNIVLKCKQLLQKDSISVRQVASTVGLLKSVTQAILPASMFCRHLQKGHIEALAKSANYEAKMSLSVLQKEELTTWIQNLNMWNGRPMWPSPVTYTIQTDSSLKGWGECARTVM
jgi:hypothetical protein